MKFQGKEVITWSINDYLGLANLPEIKKVDGDAAAEHGAAYPMGARMMSGHTEFHEQLEQELAALSIKNLPIFKLRLSGHGLRHRCAWFPKMISLFMMLILMPVS